MSVTKPRIDADAIAAFRAGLEAAALRCEVFARAAAQTGLDRESAALCMAASRIRAIETVEPQP